MELAARRRADAHMLRTEHPLGDGGEGEYEPAAAAEAAADEADVAGAGDAFASLYADDTPLFTCMSANVDSILQLLHAIRLDKKDQVRLQH